MTQATIIIDAKNKKLGRMASQVALALRGKTGADFLPHSLSLPKVIVKNADQTAFLARRLKNSFYARYSGYPGGRKITSAWEVAKKDKREVLRRAILGMLPKNRLRKIMIKNLIIYHGEDK